jgi:hypothetical protein
MSVDPNNPQFYRLIGLASIPIYVVIPLVLEQVEAIPIVRLDPKLLTGITIALIGAAGSILWLASFLSRQTLTQPELSPSHIYMVRFALFDGISMLGMLLRLLGAGWIVAIPFFIVSAGAMVSLQPAPEDQVDGG